MAVAIFLLLTMPSFHAQQRAAPITKEKLLAALAEEALSSEELIREVENLKVDFDLPIADEQPIRSKGKYLGKKGLDDLIAAIRKNRQPPTLRPSAPSATPAVTTTPQPQSKGTAAIELVGIGGTGVSARVSTVRVHTFASPSTTVYLTVENTSSSGTITNIGFFVKVASKPTEGAKVTVPGEITPPGNYKFSNADLAVETPTFKAVCSFAFLTIRSSSFHNGNVGSGIPPGQSTRFSIGGDGFLKDFSSRQLERGIMLRFQGIGNDDLNDIALYPNPNVLFSLTDPMYQISKVAPK